MIKGFCSYPLQRVWKYRPYHVGRIEGTNTYCLQSFRKVNGCKSFAESESIISYLSDSTMQYDLSQIIAEHKAVYLLNR